MQDVSEFLASVELNRDFGEVRRTVTYQDSCHLLHGQKISAQPRRIIGAIPGVVFRELPLTELCCGVGRRL